jgi:hypothetical protein
VTGVQTCALPICEPQDPRVSAVGEESLEQFGPARSAVLDRTDRSGQRARIASAKLLDQRLEGQIQTVSVKQRRDKQERLPKPLLYPSEECESCD